MRHSIWQKNYCGRIIDSNSILPQTRCKRDAHIMKLPACVNDIITWDFKQNIEIHADKLSLVQPLNCQSLSHYIERRTEIPRDDNRL